MSVEQWMITRESDMYLNLAWEIDGGGGGGGGGW